MATEIFRHRYVAITWDITRDCCVSGEFEIGDQLFVRGNAVIAQNMRHFCAIWTRNKREHSETIPREFTHFERRFDTDAVVTWATYVDAEAQNQGVPVGKVPIPPILFQHQPAFAFTTVERILELDQDFSEVARQIFREQDKRKTMKAA